MLYNRTELQNFNKTPLHIHTELTYYLHVYRLQKIWKICQVSIHSFSDFTYWSTGQQLTCHKHTHHNSTSPPQCFAFLRVPSVTLPAAQCHYFHCPAIPIAYFDVS